VHLSRAVLDDGLDHVRRSPRTGGRLRLIVSRPGLLQRAVLTEAVLDPATGLVGDNWLTRGSRHSADGSADPDRQITVMNVRVAELVADSSDRVPLAGDQLYVDLDLSLDNLPAGSLLAVGDAVLEVSAAPHLGCAKFVDRFGQEAMRFVNSGVGRSLRLRGMNAKVVVGGAVRLGDPVEPREVRSLRSSSAEPACAAGWQAPPAPPAPRQVPPPSRQPAP
jgi:MOSC domain-containing protein YiiM